MLLPIPVKKGKEAAAKSVARPSRQKKARGSRKASENQSRDHGTDIPRMKSLGGVSPRCFIWRSTAAQRFPPPRAAFQRLFISPSLM